MASFISMAVPFTILIHVIIGVLMLIRKLQKKSPKDKGSLNLVKAFTSWRSANQENSINALLNFLNAFCVWIYGLCLILLGFI